MPAQAGIPGRARGRARLASRRRRRHSDRAMHDIKAIRAKPEAFDAAMARRGVEAASDEIIARDRPVREEARRAEAAAVERNARTKRIRQALARGDTTEADALRNEEAIDIAAVAKGLAGRTDDFAGPRDDLLATLPNLPAPDVPDGLDETANVVVHTRGTPPAFPFTPREHDALALRFGYDPDAAAAIAGARFAVLRGPLARLHRALGQFMLDRNVAVGWTEVAPPLIVHERSMFGTGQLPKFKDDLFVTSKSLTLDGYVDRHLGQFFSDGHVPPDLDERYDNLRDTITSMWEERQKNTDRIYLIPTAEVSLTNLVRGRVLDAGELPLRMTALTPCFRAEAGSAGRDTRGLIRQHQFDKVELVSIVADADAAAAEHEAMTAHAESLLDALGLPFRRMLLCAGDMGFAARKTYDLEVWLPGQDQYREISSVSDCGDFQARRMNWKDPSNEPRGGTYKTKGQKGETLVHTLNGSALAVGRCLVAVLENHQRADGTVAIPPALHDYMGGITELTPT